ncbi:metallopeptidase [Bisporella sp. PMI_857]|nr:metallopeptidase [Bisporella sp. PMI_857]
MSSFKIPPQPPLDFNHTPEDIISLTENTVKETRAIQDKIIAEVPVDKATFANTILPLALNENKALNLTRHLKFYSSTSTSEALRAASRRSQSLVQAAGLETLLRPELSTRVSAVFNLDEDLDEQDATYLKRLHTEFQRNRLGANDHFKDVQARLLELKMASLKSLNAASGIWLSRDELDGLPADVMAALEEKDGELLLPFRKPHFENAMRWVRSGAIRRRIYVGNDRRCLDNVPRLKEIILLRDEAAKLLGYENHLAYRIEDTAMKDPEWVRGFMNDLYAKVKPIAEGKIKELFELKKHHLGEEMTDEENHFFIWDFSYYGNLAKENEAAFDEERFLEYFELYNSLLGMLGIFSHIFGLRFEESSSEKLGNLTSNHVVIWHESVRVFTVWNDDGMGGEFIGYLYLDLFPRPDKFNHVGTYGLQMNYIDKDGARYYPSSALVMNLHPPTDNSPSLLTPEQGRSLFHELGHAVHGLVANSRYASLNSFHPRDFVEIPCILLENWFWAPSILRSIGVHYSHLPSFSEIWESNNHGTEKPDRELPHELIAQLVGTKDLNEAVSLLKQHHIYAFDLKIHSAPREKLEVMNLSEEWNRQNVAITGLCGAEVLGEGWEWGHGSSRLGMWLRNYDATCYVYVTGKAVAQDLFVTKFNKDPLDRVTGMHWRHTVLEATSSNGLQNLKEFLGREPNSKARSRELGLS